MEESNRKKIAMIARTNGLEYDDRIRKECITLSKKYDIKIFVNFSDNRKEKGVTSYGIPFESFQLKSRETFFKQENNLILKSLEFYLRVRKKLKHFDIQWIHGEETAIFALFAPKNKFIWDQHELPQKFFKKPFKFLFQLIEMKCSYMLHANSYRIEYLKKIEMIKMDKKHISIRNYPDNVFTNESDDTDKAFIDWLSGHEYVYLQGISKKDRLPYNTLESILSGTDLKIVIVGGLYETDKNKLVKKYGSTEFKNRVYNTGMIDQLDIPIYLKKSKFSIVLYDTSKPNNRYCEPNRLYQALSYCVPVIVGSNEPMKELVDSNGFGIVLEDDGNNIKKLKRAVKIIDIRAKNYKEIIFKNRQKLSWSNQEYKILNVINLE